eukprot:351855-Chlamydomonas_euryale.AAC.3
MPFDQFFMKKCCTYMPEQICSVAAVAIVIAKVATMPAAATSASTLSVSWHTHSTIPDAFAH